MRRVLVLGGTAWLGREIARTAIEGGADVTCVARGTSGSAPSGARFVSLDRSAPRAFDGPSAAALAGDWDEVIEIAWDPAVTQPSLEALADRAAHWTLVSTVSVYADNTTAGEDESAPLVDPLPADVPATVEVYGEAKVAVERSTTARLGDRLLVVRPGLIAGPGDGSGRFGYWPARFARGGGRALVPETADRMIQVIDVGDLADYVVEAASAGVHGAVNAVGDPTPLAEVLALAAEATGFGGELVPRDDEWLLAHDVAPWAGPRSLPLWLPREVEGMMRRSNTRYRDTGGRLRPLRDTVARVLDDERARGIDAERRSGLTPDEERELLAG